MYNHKGLMLIALKDAFLHALKFPFSTRGQPWESIRVIGGGDICDKPGWFVSPSPWTSLVQGWSKV